MESVLPRDREAPDMRPGPPSTLLLVLALLLALAGPGVAAGAPAAAPGTDRPLGGAHSDAGALGVGAAAVQSDGFDPNVTVLEVEIDDDGDARWTITHSFDLADANETRAFDRLADEFERGEVGGNYLEAMRRASEAASESTGRSMAIRNVSRDATVTNGTGRLVTTLTWTSFARVSGDTVRVSDAFDLATGSWLPGLAADERLVVSPPPGYRIDTAPSADSFRNGSLVWEGPTAFAADFSITYRQLTPPPEPPNVTVSPTPPPGPFDGGLLPIVVGGVGVGLVLLVAYLLLRRETPVGPIAEANGGVDSDDEGGGTTAAEPEGAAAEPAAPGDAAEAEPEEEEATGAEEPEPEVDPELLSDEERVEHLLRRNGGRMKQANIVRETNWSNAKVSQLLSAMDEDGRIDKLRIGRENLITLPDEEPGEFGE
jgi:hypothetical protein